MGGVCAGSNHAYKAMYEKVDTISRTSNQKSVFVTICNYLET